MNRIDGAKVAILVTDGFEEVEMTEPRKALDDAGAETKVVSPKPKSVRGWNHTEWGAHWDVDIPLERARPEDFDAILLPGGVINPDKLRMDEKAVAFAKAFFDAGKPVFAICHGPSMVIETGEAHGRRIASWPSLKTDVRNAGGEWVDEEVVVDHNLVTSRKPDDIPAFNTAINYMLSQSGERREPASGKSGSRGETHGGWQARERS